MKKNTNQRKHFLLIYVLLICIMSSTLFSGHVWAQQEHKTVVRVGVYNKEGSLSYDEKGEPCGYDYEYLMKLSEYTGWEYEFVEGTWNECVSMLKSGQIDLLTGVQKTEERKAEMRFSKIPAMYVSACLIENTGQDVHSYEDFDSFDGMTIGMVRGSSMAGSLKEYSEEKGFHYKGKEFESVDTLLSALRADEIDAACLSSNQELGEFRSIGVLFRCVGDYYAGLAAHQKKEKSERGIPESIIQTGKP